MKTSTKSKIIRLLKLNGFEFQPLTPWQRKEFFEDLEKILEHEKTTK